MTVLTTLGHGPLLVSLKMNSSNLSIIFIHGGDGGGGGGDGGGGGGDGGGGGGRGGESKFLKYIR